MSKKLAFALIAIATAAIPLFSQAQATIGTTAIGVSAVGGVATSGPVAVPPIIAIPICNPFTRSLSIGSIGADVTALQQYLKAQGYFNGPVTGYFGVITRGAVGNWQENNSVVTQTNSGLGIFGPLSRAMFLRVCKPNNGGGTGGTAPTSTTTGTVTLSVTPSSGIAPLTVQFEESGPQGATLGNMISFGDGATGTLAFVPTCSSCNAMAFVSHTYSATGTYTATVTGGAGCACPANGICNCPNIPIIATATVTVTATSTSGGTGGTGGGSSSTSSIVQLDAPATTTLGVGGIAEIRNESTYFTVTQITSSAATIQITPVGCWNSFPSDPAPRIICMIAFVPIPPQTLSIGQSYAAANYSVMLTGIGTGTATFSIGVGAGAQ